MVMDQVQRRRRRCGSKVKTGCGTCKIRRVKCDEARPSCQRCQNTGRKCDGYGRVFLIPSKYTLENSDLIQRISTHITGNAEEKRGFHFFLQNTAAELSGYYDSSFWENIILAASAQEPSLRHALIAIGALHEDFSQKRLTSSKSSPDERQTEFALSQYAKAMGALRRSLSSGKQEPLTALMSCILFVCFDSLRGWCESAMVHLQCGLRILRDLRISSPDNHIVEDKIAPLFMRLSMQSIIYVDTRSTLERKAFAHELIDVSAQEIIILEQFASIEEARNALNQAADGMFRIFYMWDGALPFSAQPPESYTLFDKYASQLYLWNLAFEKFMMAKRQDLNSKQLRGVALLKIHHTTAKIMAGVRPCIRDLRPFREVANAADKFIGHLDDFQIIIDLSRSLIAAAEQDAKSGRSPLIFSTDLGLVGPLYYICVRCPISDLRASAMELLLRCPRREGMWNSVLIAKMVKEYWEIKALHKAAHQSGAEVDRFGFPVPLSNGVDLSFTDGMNWEWKLKKPSRRRRRCSYGFLWADSLHEQNILQDFGPTLGSD